MQEVQVNQYTLGVVNLTAMCDEHAISNSTGFFWEHAGNRYLITNWHCVTGIDPFTGKCLNKDGARPNILRIRFLTSDIGKVLHIATPLFDDKGNPKWFVHPTAGEQVDVVVLLLGEKTDLIAPGQGPQPFAETINNLSAEDLATEIGAELFVVGYPRNLSLIATPLWKRATIATEPALFEDSPGRRQVWIDCTTREGMSGSPVLAIQNNMHRTAAKPNTVNAGSGHSLFGIYSGRLIDPMTDPNLDDMLLSQIGIVWPKALIANIIDAAQPDNLRREDAFKKTSEFATKK